VSTDLILSKQPRELQYSVKYEQLKEILAYAYQYCGRTPRGENENEQRAEIEVQISMLMDTLEIGENRFLTLSEIKQAFREGLALLSGTNYGLNNETYAKFLSAFITKKKGLPDYSVNKRIAESRKEVTEEERENIFQEGLKYSLNIFKETGEVRDLGNGIYSTLWRKGLLRFDKDQWNKYLEEAGNIEGIRLTNERSMLEKLGQGKSLEQTRRLKDIDLELDSIVEGKTRLDILARKLALRDYFINSH
jgi:hypothetical protein